MVSGQNVVKLLYVPKFRAKTAVNMSEAIIDSMDDFGLNDRINIVCFVTGASSTETKGGLLSVKDRNTCDRKQLTFFAMLHWAISRMIQMRMRIWLYKCPYE